MNAQITPVAKRIFDLVRSSRVCESSSSPISSSGLFGAVCGVAISIAASSQCLATPSQVFRAQAQDAPGVHERLLLRVQSNGGSFVVRDVVAATGEEIPVEIQITSQDRNSYKFVMIKGLPADFTFSAGFRTNNAWLVSLSDIENLTLKPPESYKGDLILQFLLIKRSNEAPEQQLVAIRIEDGPVSVFNVAPTNARQDAGIDATGSVQSDPAPQPVIDREKERVGLQRAERLLQNADIVSARLMYEALALKGSARAAYAMGQTFDPEFLRRFAMQSLQPDLPKARYWYKKAMELGSPDAQARLAALE